MRGVEHSRLALGTRYRVANPAAHSLVSGASGGVRGQPSPELGAQVHSASRHSNTTQLRKPRTRWRGPCAAMTMTVRAGWASRARLNPMPSLRACLGASQQPRTSYPRNQAHRTPLLPHARLGRLALGVRYRACCQAPQPRQHDGLAL